MQVNARFAFLTGPRPCPTLTHAWNEGEQAQSISCWSHDGSYLSEIGLFTRHSTLYIRAGSAAVGFLAVELNNSTVEPHGGGRDTAMTDDLTVSIHTSHHLVVRIGAWTLNVENSDGFVNIAGLSVNVPLRSLDSHGLLGQTWKRSSDRHHVIEGDVDDYSINENHVFGTAFAYNLFEY